MANETPQDASQLAINLVDQWYFGTNNATMISPADRTVLYQRIAAVIQAERERQAVELRQAQEQTNTGARIIAFHQAARAMCFGCRHNAPTLRFDGFYIHGPFDTCRASRIHKLIAAEEAANASL